MTADAPAKAASGLYIVRRKENFIHWEAWRVWYAQALGRVLFLDKMTVPFAFPPETQSAANYVAARINELQNGGSKSVPENPAPWVRWSEDEIARRIDLEKRRNSGSDLITPDRVKSVIEAARNRHWKIRKHRPGVSSEAPEPDKYAPTPEELREREEDLKSHRLALVKKHAAENVAREANARNE